MTPLKDLCVTVVARNFEESPDFGKLPDKFVKRVVDLLDLDLPLELVGTLITDEDYWKRRCCNRWKNCQVGRRFAPKPAWCRRWRCTGCRLLKRGAVCREKK